jgi:hypothetical protein
MAAADRLTQGDRHVGDSGGTCGQMQKSTTR